MNRHNKSYQRIDRIKEQLLRELSTEIQALKDPRFGIFTLTDAEIARDYSWAKVYYTVLDNEKQQDAQHAFDAAKGRLRNALSHKISLFRMPELSFIYDTAEEQARTVDKLLAQVANEPPIEE
ncbi:MAG: 30S ribosome-binding factor RbfA [Neisseriaceae bacterium]|nr:30S ribosome-binding factor RbfA [Neisseriaceae bacterium]